MTEVTAISTSFADADLAVVVNPNNPDGRIIAKDALLALAGVKAVPAPAGRRRGLHGCAARLRQPRPEIDRANIVVLRSFGKFFGLAGLRLGFALAAPQLPRAARPLGPWAVSGPAIAIGERALADAAWIEATRGGWRPRRPGSIGCWRARR